MRSVHERHRVALSALADGAHLPVVTEAARTLGIEVEHAPVTLRSGLSAGPGPFAQLVVALGHRPQDAVSVDCWVSRPDGGNAPYLTLAGGLGWVSVAPVTDDPVAVTAAGLLGQEVTLMRYHPGRRATARVVAPVAVPECPVAYAKVFSDHRGCRATRPAPNGWREAAAAGAWACGSRTARRLRRRPVRAVARTRSRACPRPTC